MWNGKLAMTASLITIIVLRWFPGFEMFKKMGVSKNTTDNQSLPSVILIYTIHNLLFKFHLYNCNYKWNTAWPYYKGVHQKILTLPLFMKLFALYTINLKGRKFSYVQLFWARDVSSLMDYLPVRGAYVEHSCARDACDNEYLY